MQSLASRRKNSAVTGSDVEFGSSCKKGMRWAFYFGRHAFFQEPVRSRHKPPRKQSSLFPVMSQGTVSRTTFFVRPRVRIFLPPIVRRWEAVLLRSDMLWQTLFEDIFLSGILEPPQGHCIHLKDVFRQNRCPLSAPGREVLLVVVSSSLCTIL